MRLHGLLLFSINFLLDLTDDSGGGKMYNSCFLAKSLMARVRPIIAAALANFVLTTTSTLVLPVISAFDAMADVIQQGIGGQRKRKTREEVWCACEREKRQTSMGWETANTHLLESMPCLFDDRQVSYVMCPPALTVKIQIFFLNSRCHCFFFTAFFTASPHHRTCILGHLCSNMRHT